MSPGSDLYREIIRLLQPFWAVTLLATVMGAVAGVATTMLLAAINRGMQAEGPITLPMLLAFLGLCVVSLTGSAVAGAGNSLIGQRVIAALRKDISARILCAPIAAIEQVRVHRLMATLNQDVDALSVFTFNVSGYVTALAVTIGCIGYLLFLSPGLFLLALAAIAGGILINRHARGEWLRYYEGVGTAQDELQKQYRAITDGAKELRINRPRRLHVLYRRLAVAADRIADLKTAAMRLYWIADTGGAALFFLAIGVMIALRGAFGLEQGIVSGFVIVMLYVKGPIEQVAAGLPMLVQAQVAFRRVAELMTQFASPEPHLLVDTDIRQGQTIQEIALQNVVYRFHATAGGTAFQLGPINLTIRRGEALFIVGENGSGKTTLVKLLLGLYTPQEGELLLDGEPVTADRRDDYRQLFSAVFSDYFLFDDLVGGSDMPAEKASAYLEMLQIAHKVRIDDNAFSTLDLSTGQRRRLALVHTYLEQRPVMMFDEWAADQDPTFRRIFYTELLPDLKRQGRTLIVVSHDDRYFDAADRIIRLDGGRIAEDRVMAAGQSASA